MVTPRNELRFWSVSGGNVSNYSIDGPPVDLAIFFTPPLTEVAGVSSEPLDVTRPGSETDPALAGCWTMIASGIAGFTTPTVAEFAVGADATTFPPAMVVGTSAI